MGIVSRPNETWKFIRICDEGNTMEIHFVRSGIQACMLLHLQVLCVCVFPQQKPNVDARKSVRYETAGYPFVIPCVRCQSPWNIGFFILQRHLAVSLIAMLTRVDIGCSSMSHSIQDPGSQVFPQPEASITAALCPSIEFPHPTLVYCRWKSMTRSWSGWTSVCEAWHNAGHWLLIVCKGMSFALQEKVTEFQTELSCWKYPSCQDIYNMSRSFWSKETAEYLQGKSHSCSQQCTDLFHPIPAVGCSATNVVSHASQDYI